ncbi:MAG TPA: App1 family protein [Xanthomonadales bacterium]|nr:App1 family protein [Xanthomonadales bacterium]
MRTWLILLIGLLHAAADLGARELALDEQVMFVPDTARMLDDGAIEARISAWVYEFEQRPGLNSLFARKLGLDLDAISVAEQDRFRSRTQLFRVDSESMKNISIVLGDACAPMGPDECPRVELPRTNFAGRTSTRIKLQVDPAARERRWLRFAVAMPRGDSRQFKGRALIVPPEGLSVISDIDDTIKVSQVRDRHELLLNTFAREFVAVPGIAEHYQELAKTPGTRFHYVSSGPIQLFPPLDHFMREAGFPSGSVHLRESTAYSNVIPGDEDSRAHKLAAIGRLLSDFPQRRFLLIGDSGEADPEIYGEIARGHPDQVVGIRIRDVSGDRADSARYAAAFAGLPNALWQIFAEAEGLAPVP